MKTTMTITSKHQVTIPKVIWDRLQLDGVRYLDADVQGKVLHLTKANFSQKMEAFWQQTKPAVKGTVSDKSIRNAKQKAHVARDL